MQQIEFVPLNGFADYEILNDYPFTVRRADNHYVVTESIQTNGYIYVHLNRNQYIKHRLIALQFIPNNDPINNDVVDHINHDKTDNHLNNLRWVSSSDNSYNKSSHKGVNYNFIDELPDEAIPIDYYDTTNERRIFPQDKYYYYFDDDGNNIFYMKIMDDLYRIMHVNHNRAGNEFISVKDVNNRVIQLYINKFKRQHDLI